MFSFLTRVTTAYSPIRITPDPVTPPEHTAALALCALKKQQPAPLPPLIKDPNALPAIFQITQGELQMQCRIVKILGEGGHGRVFSVLCQSIGGEEQQYAMKVSLASFNAEETQANKIELYYEALYLKKITSQDRLDQHFLGRWALDAAISPSHYMLLQKQYGPDLSKISRRTPGGLDLSQIQSLTTQALTALAFLQEHGITHGDFKPENLLLDENQIRLIDFGTAFDTPYPNDGPQPAYMCSRFWRAPEIILGLPLDPTIDIWSLGCSIFELFTGSYLFPSENAARHRHMLGLFLSPFPLRYIQRLRPQIQLLFTSSADGIFTMKPEPFPDLKSPREFLDTQFTSRKSRCSEIEQDSCELLKDFIESTLALENRPSATDLLQHPFIKHTILGSSSTAMRAVDHARPSIEQTEDLYEGD